MDVNVNILPIKSNKADAFTLGVERNAEGYLGDPATLFRQRQPELPYAGYL